MTRLLSFFCHRIVIGLLFLGFSLALAAHVLGIAFRQVRASVPAVIPSTFRRKPRNGNKARFSCRLSEGRAVFRVNLSQTKKPVI
jgi:hypothetical protein